MASYVSNRDGGKTNEEGHYRFHVKAWDGNIQNGLEVTQNSPLGMSVLVSAGDLKIDYSGYGYTAWTDANSTVTISTSSPSNPRIDRIVAYIDRDETPQTVNPNNPGMLKFMAVAGTPAGSPTRPSNGTVDSAVGASNPWCDLADVLVGTGVTQITNANITDTREMVTPQIRPGSIETAKIADGAVTPPKWTNPYKFSAYASGTTAAAISTTTKIAFATEEYDTNNNFANSTYTAPVAGFYHFDAAFNITAGGAAERYGLQFWKNGAEFKRSNTVNAGAATGYDVAGGIDVQLAANDTMEVYVFNGTGGIKSVNSGQNLTYFSGHLISIT